MTDFKAAARKLINDLPADATWDDLQYRIHVRQAIEAGIADADAGRLVEVAEVEELVAKLKQKTARSAKD